MASVPPVKFSPNGEYFAYSSPDGTLKIWETSGATLKHEYTPSSHLSATCTCLSWGVLKGENTGSSKKKKRRRSRSEQNAHIIALGTTSGAILLYSLAKGDLLTQLADGHTGTVTSVCWNQTGDTLYSSSTDQHVIEWDVTSATAKRKWKADKAAVTSLSLCHTERHLLTAGRSIKLWDLDTQQVVQSFTGHATIVFDLLPVPCSKCGPDGDHANMNGDTIDSSYFFSAATGDRLINVWQVSSASTDKNAVASFSLPEEPVNVNFRPPSQSGQPFLLTAVTKSGQMLIFENQLNGRCKKPLKPSVSLQIATSAESRDDIPKPIPVLSSYVYDDSDKTIVIAHGNFVRPVFERMPYSSTEAEMCLVREDPSVTVIKLQTSVSKVKNPEVSSEVTVLAPGHMAPSKPSTSQGTPQIEKRKRKASTDMTIGERISAISIDKKSSNAKQPPKADTLAILLAQGLQSQDNRMLNNVLQRRDEGVIRNTVKRLPLSAIVPLVQELAKKLHGHAQSAQNYVKWVRAVLVQHTSYLMSFPELVETVSTLYHVMDSRHAVFNRLSRLQGKLDLMLSQISSQEQEVEDSLADQPLLVYQDESSDEEYRMEDVIPDHSESEDNWEELSNLDEDSDDDEDNNMEDEDDNEDNADAQKRTSTSLKRKDSGEQSDSSGDGSGSEGGDSDSSSGEEGDTAALNGEGSNVEMDSDDDDEGND